MSRGEITAEIERFIRDYISSVEQLEVLLLLASDADKEWTAQEAAQNLYRQSDSVAAKLTDLCSRGLLTQSAGTPPAYRFRAAERHSDIVRGLDAAYQTRKDAVIQLIFSKPSDTLRTFSDAFRLRRKD